MSSYLDSLFSRCADAVRAAGLACLFMMLAQAAAASSGFNGQNPFFPGASLRAPVKVTLDAPRGRDLLASQDAEHPYRYQARDNEPEDICRSALRPPGDRVLACTQALLAMPSGDGLRADLYAHRASAYYIAGAWEMALEDFALSLEHNPDLPEALNGRCWILASENLDLAQARRDCDRAIALDPSYHEAYDSRAIIDMREGDWASAWQDFNAAVNLRADVAAFRYGRGLASLALGDSEAAQRDINAAIRINPGVVLEYRKLGLDTGVAQAGPVPSSAVEQ